MTKRKNSFFNRLLVWIVFTVSVPLLIWCIIGVVGEARIWLSGRRVKCEIISMSKVNPDEYEIMYVLPSISHTTTLLTDSKLISRKAYEKLKKKESIEIIYSEQSKGVIYLDLEERNKLLKLIIGIVVFALMTFGSAREWLSIRKLSHKA